MTNTDDLTVLVQWLSNPRFAALTRVHDAAAVLAERRKLCGDHAVARAAAQRLHVCLSQLQREQRAIALSTRTGAAYGEYVFIGKLERSASADPADWRASSELATLVRRELVRGPALEPADASANRCAVHVLAETHPDPSAPADVRGWVGRALAAGVAGVCLDDRHDPADAGTVLSPTSELIAQLSAARFECDVRAVPAVLLARTHAEHSRFVCKADARDLPFVLGATELSVPPFHAACAAVLLHLVRAGSRGTSGSVHQLVAAENWLRATGVAALLDAALYAAQLGGEDRAGACSRAFAQFVSVWQREAGAKPYAAAVAALMDRVVAEDCALEAARAQWHADMPGALNHGSWNTAAAQPASSLSFDSLYARADSLGLKPIWDRDHARTASGALQVCAGGELAAARALACAPYADVLWLQSDKPDMAVAQRFARAIHAEFPGKLLAYGLNAGPDAAMSDEEARWFGHELAAAGYVLQALPL
jgi:isocitrate lyase